MNIRKWNESAEQEDIWKEIVKETKAHIGL